MTYFLGIDPGKSGGLGFVPKSSEDKAFAYPIPESERDCADIIEEFRHIIIAAAIENVHAMPKQGVSSTFTFGQSYGFLRGLLVAFKIPYTNPSSMAWQKDLNCRSKGDKNITKHKAQSLFPYLKITHATADALLLAEWTRGTLK